VRVLAPTTRTVWMVHDILDVPLMALMSKRRGDTGIRHRHESAMAVVLVAGPRNHHYRASRETARAKILFQLSRLRCMVLAAKSLAGFGRDHAGRAGMESLGRKRTPIEFMMLG